MLESHQHLTAKLLKLATVLGRDLLRDLGSSIATTLCSNKSN
jgi:hypothetical protein